MSVCVHLQYMPNKWILNRAPHVSLLLVGVTSLTYLNGAPSKKGGKSVPHVSRMDKVSCLRDRDSDNVLDHL